MRLTIALLFVTAITVHSQTDTLRPRPVLDTLAARRDTVLRVVAKPLPKADTTYTEKGVASWYGQKFEGRYTSSGEIFRVDSLTAAHKKLPFGTLVRVTNLKNDSVVVVKITDRLPQNSTRCIDLTPTAARKLNFLRAGLANVKLEVIGTAPIHKAPRKPRAPAKPKPK